MHNFCTYLTIYKGNQLPPFYIGSTYVERIKHGYRGSVSSIEYKNIWKRELKNHPELFKTIILTYHLTRGEATEKEAQFQKQLKVISNPLYMNKVIIDRNGVWYQPSEEIRKKWSTNRTGAGNPNYGRRYKLDEQARANISKGHIGLIRSETHRKNLSKALLGHPTSQQTKDKIRQSRSIIKWQITTPTNEIFIIQNLKHWCEQNFINGRSALTNLTQKGRYKKYIALKVN